MQRHCEFERGQARSIRTPSILVPRCHSCGVRRISGALGALKDVHSGPSIALMESTTNACSARSLVDARSCSAFASS